MNVAFPRGAVGRGDLARLIKALPPERAATAAKSLGFERIREPDPEIAIEWADADDLDLEDGKPREPGGKTILESKRPASVELALWRLETMHFQPEPTDPEVDPKQFEDFVEKDSKGDGRSLFATPAPTPLALWSRLWPHLRVALQSTLPSREPDVSAYVRAITRGESLSRIPCLKRRAWANRISVWIDRSPRLVPFWWDQSEVCRRLHKVCNRSGIELRLLDARAQAWLRGNRRGMLAGFRFDAAVPILVLGDLGVFGTESQRAAWRRTGRTLLQDGVSLSALVPCSSGRWLPFMTKTWNAIPWERGRQRRMAFGAQAWSARAERLLKMVSPATLVQPSLLREIRLLLPPADADASTEVDVWNHMDVCASSGTAWVLRPEAAAKWRAKFVSDIEPAWQRRVSETIGKWHKELPRELLRAETLVWNGLLSNGNTPGNLEDAIAFAMRLRQSIGRRGNAPGLDAQLNQYAWTLLKGLPESVVDATPTLRMIRDKLEGSPKTRHWAIRQVGRRLEFALNERGSAWPSHVEGPGSPVAWFVAARPWMTIVRGQTEEQHRLEPGLSLLFELDEPFTIRTDRCSITIAPWHREPWAMEVGRDRFGLWADAEIHGVVQRFRWIPPGRFLMGSPENESGRYENEGPQHQVTWTQGRWLGDTPVTQALWKAVHGTNPSHFQSDKQSDKRSSDERPVEQVSAEECDAFGAKIGMGLPSEAEWEYACRGGTTTATWVGDLVILGDNNAPLLDNIAWYGGNCGVAFDLDEKGYDATDWTDKQYEFDRGGTRVVRQKKRNLFGLYDMLGNVYEWCSDVHDTYNNDATTDPRPVSPTQQRSSRRVLRGGAWDSGARLVRAAHRDAHDPGGRCDYVGFRLARGLAPSEASSAERSEGRSSRGKAEPTAVQRHEAARVVKNEETVVTPDLAQGSAQKGWGRRWLSRLVGDKREAAPARDEQAPKQKK